MVTDAASPDSAPRADTDDKIAATDGNAPETDGERRSRARLRWRCRRGMRELDALLVRFFDRDYLTLSAADKQRFSQLLELPNPDLHAYLMGWYEAAEPGLARLLERMRSV